MKRFVICVVGIACLTLLVQGAFSQAPPAPTNLAAKVVHSSADEHEGMAQAVGLSWQFMPPASMYRIAFRIYRSV
ncbi:MAG TPA: hypothetical protein VMF59_09220, partial [Bacteroidota bacterium]|nr:hypothetical protein [Bacteroidota bacterium]